MKLPSFIEHFLMAVQFYTRIPIPFKLNWREDSLNKATAYFPLIGLALGLFLAFILPYFEMLFSRDLSVLLIIVIGVFLTGGFHEDGFADYCDGVGGGWEQSDKLRIMQDSRIGTYGSLGLILILLMKWQALSQIHPSIQFYAIIIAMTWSRWSSLLIMITLKYQRNEGTAKPLAKGLTIPQFLLGSFFTWVILFIPAINIQIVFMAALFPMLLSTILFRLHMKVKIGGYTGDSLGANQQISEVFYYLGVVALWQFL